MGALQKVVEKGVVEKVFFLGRRGRFWENHIIVVEKGEGYILGLMGRFWQRHI